MVDIKKFDIATTVTDSLIEVFDMMLSMKLDLSDDDFKGDLDVKRIVGAVNLAGKVMGTITVNVGDDFSRKMTASMLGVEVEEVAGGEDVKDVISEICNIVGGNLKSKFCDAGLTCLISPPSFTTGDDFKIESLNTERHERYLFSYNKHIVIVEVGVKIGSIVDTAEEGPERQIEVVPVQITDIENFDIKTLVTDSITDMFDTMLSMELETSEEDLKQTLDGSRLVGSLSFIGSLMGSINILVNADFSRQMTASMLGMEVDEVEGVEDVKDVISEVCNIVGGNLKSKFCDAGMTCELSTPSFTSGSDFVIETRDMVRYDRFSFHHQGDAVLVEVVLKSSGDSKPEENKNDTTIPADKESMQVDDPQKMIDDVFASEAQVDEDSNEATDNPAGAVPVTAKAGVDNDHLAALHNTVDIDETKMNLDFILDIPVEITVELGQTRKKINELLDLDRGSVLKFSNLAGEPVDIQVNETLIAKGEIVVDREKYGVLVTEIASRMERIQSLS